MSRRKQMIGHNSIMAAALLTALLVPGSLLLRYLHAAELHPNAAYKKVGSAVSTALVHGQHIVYELKTLQTILQLTSGNSVPTSSPVPDSKNRSQPSLPPDEICKNSLKSQSAD